MTPPADVPAFYAALGIELPGWAHTNATVRCFADPGAHAHEDRNPSCSVSLEHGAWRCWACGARGGAYDAALAHGHTPAAAMQLLVHHGLAELSDDSDQPRRRVARRTSPNGTTWRPRERQCSSLAVTDADVAAWSRALVGERGRRWRARLERERLSSPAVMRELELGYNRARITIPIRDAAGQLRGVLRYWPGGRSPRCSPRLEPALG